MNDNRLSAIIRQLSEYRGDSPLDNLVIALNQAIESDYILVAKLDENGLTAQTIAVSHNGELQENFSYRLKHTPCEEVCCNSVCIYNGNVQREFPNDQLLIDMGIESYLGIPLTNKQGEVLGICAALYQTTVEDTLATEYLFTLFSGMIAGHLESSERLSELEMCWSLIQGSTEAICITDLDSKIKYINPSFERITGYKREQIIGESPKILQSGVYDKEFYQQMWSSISKQGFWSGEIWNRNAAVNLFLEKVSILQLNDSNGNPSHYASYFSDITAYKKTESLLQFEKKFDNLTKLANREHFLQQVNKLLDGKKHPQYQTGLIIFNINQFRLINETYGSRAADEVLKHVATIINSCVHSRDDAARISGDEFALMINTEDSAEEIKSLAATLATKLKLPHEIEDIEIQFTVSIGIAIFPADGTTAEQLLDNAYEAMLDSKRQGSGAIGLFSSKLQEQSVRRSQLRKALIKAVRNREIEAVFQPIIDPYEHRVARMEALARWRCNGTPISPEEFIPLAEEYGLIPAIGQQILEQGCQLVQQFIDAGKTPPVVAVNRSIYEFLAIEHHDEWLATIDSFGLPSELFCFEITESALASNDHSILDTLQELKSANCSIAIDDFGTGYSSLNYLRRFPADILKVDREFVEECETNTNDRTLVSTIVAMGHALGMKIIAEGVEHDAQLKLLKEMNVDLIQGYYYSAPLPADQVIKFVAEFNTSSMRGRSELTLES